MNKVVELLEAYCEWIAIALGGVFLIWVLWAYVLFTPVGQTITDKGEKISLVPGTVDDYVKKMEADPLEREIVDPTPQPAPNQQLDLYPKWLLALSGSGDQVAALPPQWPGSLPMDIHITPNTVAPVATVLVTTLPVVPPSQSLDIKSARAFVAAAAALPGAAAPPPPANGQVQQAAGHDINYVRLTYSITPADIDAAFKLVNIPPQAATTAIIDTKLYRQEQLPDGTWGPATVVPLLATGIVMQPLPQPGAQATEIAPFRTWAESDEGQSDLLRPAFYQVLSGEGPWDATVDDAVMSNAAEIDKAKQEAERLALEKQRAADAARAAAARANRPPGSTTPPRSTRPPSTPRRPKPSGLVNDPARPSTVADLAGLELAQAIPNGGFMGAGNPGFPQPPAGMGMPPGAPAAPRPTGLPPAPFNPAGQPPIIGWAYDETVKEGRTYRYQCVYAIRNPVYAANANIVSKPELAQVFALSGVVDENAWSTPVTVKPTTEFYLAGPNWPASNVPSSVRIEVFKWASGKWQGHIFPVGAGDRIGSEDAKTDYQTNDTLVDVRYDARGGGRPYVLILGADGQLTERDPATDLHNPRLALLRSNVQANAAGASGAGAGGAGIGGGAGAPPPGPGMPGGQLPPGARMPGGGPPPGFPVPGMPRPGQ